MFHCLGDYDDSEPLLFRRVFSLAGFCHKSEKVSRKKANIEAENSLRDRSYCWRVLSDQVRVNNIIFTIVGSTDIVFWGRQTIGHYLQLIIIIIIIFIYLPSDVISQEKKLQLPLGLSPKHRNMQFL